MRLNRKIRIGAAIVALCLLLLGLATIARNLQRNAGPPRTASSAEPTPGGNAAVAPVSTRQIAYARENIPERSIVTPGMLVLKDAPAGFDTTAFVTDPNAQALGFIAAHPIEAGAQIRQADFLGHISDVGIAGALLPGRRAMIIPIGNKATLHELVRIGDRVDIMASFEQQESRVIAEDVRVLAVDVFGSDYPQVKIAMRGDYKAPSLSYSAAVPPSPPGQGSPQAANSASNPDAPAGQQAPPAGAAGAPGAGPEPTPTQGPPPARPEAALTIEVTPQQATDIALTQAAGQNLDFLLRGRSEPSAAGGTTGTPGTPGAGGILLASGETRTAAFSTRDRISPYATRLKRSGAASASASRRASTKEATGAIRELARAATSMGSPPPRFDPPRIPGPDVPPPSRSIPPANLGGVTRIDAPSAPQPPATYDIPIFTGKGQVRTDTVRRPRQ